MQEGDDAVVITKALLLGYEIMPFGIGGSYYLRYPDGKAHIGYGGNLKGFPSIFAAACRALELSNVR